MRTSWTEPSPASSPEAARATAVRRRTRPRGAALVLLASAAVGGLAGVALPRVGSTAALLTSQATVTSPVDLVPCDPAAWEGAVAELAPVHRWPLDAADLRPGDVAASALLECDAVGAAWDLDPASPGVATTGPLALTTPEDLTVTLWLGPTAAVSAEGELIALTGADRDVRVVVVPGGGVEVRYTDATGPRTLAAAPLTGDAQLLALVVDAGAVRLSVDGTDVAAGPPDVAPGPVGLTLGATAGASADVVVDDVVVLDAALPPPDLAALADAARW